MEKRNVVEDGRTPNVKTASACDTAIDSAVDVFNIKESSDGNTEHERSPRRVRKLLSTDDL